MRTTPIDLLALSDAEFPGAWAGLGIEGRGALPDEIRALGFVRYQKLTPWVMQSVTHAEREQHRKAHTIEVRGGDGGAAVHRAIDVLAQAGGFFNRAGTLVRVLEIRDARALGLRTEGTDVQRDECQPVITAITADYLGQRLDELVTFERYDARRKQMRAINCPREVALRLLSLGDWARIPILRSVMRSPFLRSDGTVCASEGYDEATATLLFRSVEIEPIEEAPDSIAAASALDELRAPFVEVPWVDAIHEAAFHSYLMTILLRPILPTVPAFIFTAPTPGAGKTLLMDCGAMIVHGITPAKRTYPKDADELRKVLQAVILCGDPVLAFDNLRAGAAVGEDALNLYVTADAVGDRTLGHSEVRRIVNSAVFAFSGNNITARADFVRRAIAIKIDPNVERPEERRFTISDLRTHVLEHRAELLRAALTLIRAFVVAGAPMPTRALLGGFEEWDRLVCGSLGWAGMPDPLLTQADIRAEDSEATSSTALFAALAIMSNGVVFKVAQVRERVEQQGNLDDLAEAIREACGDVKNLGHWLRARNGQVRGGYKLVRQTSPSAGQARWRIVPL